jgi:hypothetical protein
VAPQMNAGERHYKQASCRIAIPPGLPEEFHEQVREVLGVASNSKRSGEATALMHQVCSEADFNFMVLLLHVKPFDDGMTAEQLEHFYSKFGFVVIQHEPLLMSRVPQKPKLVRSH